MKIVMALLFGFIGIWVGLIVGLLVGNAITSDDSVQIALLVLSALIFSILGGMFGVLTERPAMIRTAPGIICILLGLFGLAGGLHILLDGKSLLEFLHGGVLLKLHLATPLLSMGIFIVGGTILIMNGFSVIFNKRVVVSIDITDRAQLRGWLFVATISGGCLVLASLMVHFFL